MVRALALIGMTGGFLVISPKLRDSVSGTFAQASTGMEQYSPFSYIGLGLAVLMGVMIYFSRGTTSR